MTRLVGVDPGPLMSAYCLLVDGVPKDCGKLDNPSLIEKIRGCSWSNFVIAPRYIIETIFPRGKAVGLETMDTQFWAGRFAEAAEASGCRWQKIDRQDVRFAICGSLNTNDSNVRQGLIDHYGGHDKAIGGKRCTNCKRHGGACMCCNSTGWKISPGPLHKFKADMWAALAIALSVYLKELRGERVA